MAKPESDQAALLVCRVRRAHLGSSVSGEHTGHAEHLPRGGPSLTGIGLGVGRQADIMTVKRMDNVGIAVEDIDAAIELFTEPGLDLASDA
jgi:hypothetical protein